MTHVFVLIWIMAAGHVEIQIFRDQVTCAAQQWRIPEGAVMVEPACGRYRIIVDERRG